jgi:hypothetical protein
MLPPGYFDTLMRQANALSRVHHSPGPFSPGTPNRGYPPFAGYAGPMTNSIYPQNHSPIPGSRYLSPIKIQENPSISADPTGVGSSYIRPIPIASFTDQVVFDEPLPPRVAARRRIESPRIEPLPAAIERIAPTVVKFDRRHNCVVELDVPEDSLPPPETLKQIPVIESHHEMLPYPTKELKIKVYQGEIRELTPRRRDRGSNAVKYGDPEDEYEDDPYRPRALARYAPNCPLRVRAIAPAKENEFPGVLHPGKSLPPIFVKRRLDPQ